MFLNNKYFSKGIYNRSIGVVLRILNDSLVEVVFPTSTGMVVMKIEKDTVTHTAYFIVNGGAARCTQFPLLNAFGLTIHKTQGLTLPHATVSLDTSMFAHGQSYVAMSRPISWQNLDITHFDPDSIKADKNMIKEYERLYDQAAKVSHRYLNSLKSQLFLIFNKII
jgi:ATP-dependent exoDNAse (exonuclease V) alpha subunit